MSGKLLNSFFDDTGGGVEVCVDLMFGCVELGPFLFALYVLGGRDPVRCRYQSAGVRSLLVAGVRVLALLGGSGSPSLQ